MFNLYENIKEIADKHGYTPSGLMLAMGKPKSTLSNLNSGRTGSLSVETIKQIADFLGEPYDVIAHGQSDAEELFDKHRILMHRVGKIENKLSEADKKMMESILGSLEEKYAD